LLAPHFGPPSFYCNAVIRATSPILELARSQVQALCRISPRPRNRRSVSQKIAAALVNTVRESSTADLQSSESAISQGALAKPRQFDQRARQNIVKRLSSAKIQRYSIGRARDAVGQSASA
jgi:hypothetical protein